MTTILLASQSDAIGEMLEETLGALGVTVIHKDVVDITPEDVKNIDGVLADPPSQRPGDCKPLATALEGFEKPVMLISGEVETAKTNMGNAINSKPNVSWGRKPADVSLKTIKGFVEKVEKARGSVTPTDSTTLSTGPASDLNAASQPPAQDPKDKGRG